LLKHAWKEKIYETFSGVSVWFRSTDAGILSAVPGIRGIRLIKLRRLVYPLMCTTVITAAVIVFGIYYICYDRTDLPDIEPLANFEFPVIGCVYDAHGQPLIELAREHRRITRYEELPPIVRDAILATEDKNFFSHSGVEYSTIPRVLSKVRIGALFSHLTRSAGEKEISSGGIFPQGGSTITQQLVRGLFLQKLTAQENSKSLLHGSLLLRGLSHVIGPRSVNKLFRKMEEMRLSLWVEEEMQNRFGSKRRAKEEILARYASFIYMGNGQYGIARAAEYYFARSVATFTVDDADKAALLAGIAKSPLTYAPGAKETRRIIHRRNQILALMAVNGFISQSRVREAEKRPIPLVALNKDKMLQAAAVVQNVLQELKTFGPDLSVEDLMQGRIHIYSTVDFRVQQIINEALEHGLEFYEKRHPSSKGLIQGSVIVLRNRDSGILAETGGRQFYKGRLSSYTDFNRVTQSLRQPGSAMKPIVYLAAFRKGTFTLESMVPDEPIGVPNGEEKRTKWISNDDGLFKGEIPLREALAESRNTVAIWITEQIGIDSVLRTSMSLGIHTPLLPYASTALGASEVNLLELANAYRSMASGILTQPYVIGKVVRDSGKVVIDKEGKRSTVELNDDALSLIQEGLRGVVRIPTGTAHSLNSRNFPIAIMGKTGTTNDFRDALFIGSTYGPDGITIAVRIGFDDNRSLGPKESGGRVALPVFKEIMLRVYREKLAGPAPNFPARMERNISAYLKGDPTESAEVTDNILASMSDIRFVYADQERF
jgi:penicillin-binding protein 1A